jgi:hypothetical protein
MATHSCGAGGGARDCRRNRRRSAKISKPPLACERLERRDLLSSQNPLAAPVLPGAHSSGGDIAAIPSAPLSGGASSAEVQEPDLSVTGGMFVYDGFPHEVVGTAQGDNDSIIDGTFTYTYNGSPNAPIDPGKYSVVAKFTSNDPNYANGTATSTLIITPASPFISVTGGTFQFDFNPHPAMATAVGIDGVTPVAGGFAFTYNGSNSPPVNAGSYAVVATFTSSDADYSNGTGSATITIPDSTIPTGIAVTGASPTSVTVSWNPVLEPSGGTPTYNVYEAIYHHATSRYSPPYYTYNLVASGSTSTSALISGLAPTPAGGIAAGHTYVVTSVDGGIESARSAAASGAPLYAPSLGYFLNGGAIWDGAFPVNVEVGQTAQITLQGYGNEPPTYSVASGPSSVSINPQTGVISISPTASDPANFTATFEATNSLGSVVSNSLAVHVLALPTIVVSGGSFTYDGNAQGATGAVAYASDGVTPLAGTFSFTYSPAIYPSVASTAPYSEAGSYIVNAYFTSADPNYGNAIGTGTLTISPAVPTVIVNDGSFGFDGLAHPATASAVGVDGVAPIDGTFTFTYNGSPDEPTAPGTYAVVATFTSNISDYTDTVATGTIVIGSQSAPSTTITLGITGTYTLSGTPNGGGLSHVINNSTAGTGLNVAGANQVGVIEGTGNTTVGDGSSLTATSIVQGSLVIGGSAGNSAVVTIATSDANGNPLGAASNGSSAAAATLSTATGTATLQTANGTADQTAPVANAIAVDTVSVDASSTGITSTLDAASSQTTSAPGTVADPSTEATCAPATASTDQAASPSTNVEPSSTSAAALQIRRSGDSSVNAGSQRGRFSSGDVLAVIDSIFADDFASDSPGWLKWMHLQSRL